MNQITVAAIFLIIIVSACTTGPDEATIEQWKAEIAEAEAGFAAMAEQEGVASAFLAYAAADAVLMRNNAVVIGKEAIRKRFEDNPPGDGTLSWAPDFVDVSESGDLGYTYGGYVYTTIDSTGQYVESKGVFHTVWKRQSDGSWKFVWD